MNTERVWQVSWFIRDSGSQPIHWPRLINKRNEILSQQLRTALLQQKLARLEVAQPLVTLCLGLIADAISITKTCANISCIDTRLTAREAESPAHLAILSQLQTIVV